MSYDYSVPVQSNLVRSVSGDLAKMQANFEHLKPVADYMLTSGTSPSAALRGFVLGDDSDANRFRFIASGADWRFQRLSGGTWADHLVMSQDNGDIRAFRTISGQTPTQSYHLATRGYVLGLTLDDHSDVDVAGAISGDLLRFDGTNWVDGRTQVAQLSDTALVSLASGEVLAYNGTQWVNSGLTLTTDLEGLTDVDLTAPASGEFLVYNGTLWVNSGLTITADHGALTGLADDDHPQYSLADGTRPFTGPVSGITPTQAAHLATKAYVDTLSVLSISGAVNLPDLLDVSDTVTSSAVSGEVLTFDGTEWVNAAPTGGGADVLAVQIYS